MDDQDEPKILPSKVHCLNCGYDLTGTVIGGTCPECGAAVTQSLRPAVVPATSTNATTSLVFGVLSLSCCPLLSVVAIILGAVALQEIKTGSYVESSRTLAIIGLWLGILGTLVGGGYLLLQALPFLLSV